MVSIPPHPLHVEYQRQMYAAPEYDGLEQGERWDYRNGTDGVIPLRRAWWDERKEEGDTTYAVARRIHPTGIHVCHGCGSSVRISEGCTYKVSRGDLSTPQFQSVENILRNYAEENDLQFANVETPIGGYIGLFDCDNLLRVSFLPEQPINEPTDPRLLQRFEEWSGRLVIHDADGAIKRLVGDMFGRFFPNQHGRLNAPWRFDGLHSYNVCCKEPLDPARNPRRMAALGRDRRALELLSDGLHRITDQLMGRIRQLDLDLEGDHIGPLSSGFVHDPCNIQAISTQENQEFWYWLTRGKISQLIEIENQNSVVASNHILELWDATKHLVENDEQASVLTLYLKCMTKANLIILSVLLENQNQAGEDFVHSLIEEDSHRLDAEFERDENNLSGFRITRTERADTRRIDQTIDANRRVVIDHLREVQLTPDRDYRQILNRHAEIDRLIQEHHEILSGEFEDEGEIGEAYTLAINAIQHELAEAYTLRIAS